MSKGRYSRRKGARFEREVARIFLERAGVELTRILDQYRTRDLGDLQGLDGYLIECKVRSTVRDHDVDSWWRDLTEKAEKADLTPLLVFRQDRRRVKVAMPLGHLAPHITADGSKYVVGYLEDMLDFLTSKGP